MATAAAALVKMRAFCLALPDTDESSHFGAVSFRVRRRPFAICGEAIMVQLDSEHAEALLKSDPRFTPYRRAKDCVRIEVETITNWSEIWPLVRESYDLTLVKIARAKARQRMKR